LAFSWQAARHIEAIRQGLRDQGLREGIDVELICRAADGDLDKLPELASDIIGAKPEIVIAIGAVTAQAVRRVSARLPMVYAVVIDPVADGFAAGLGEPHLNSGITTFDPGQADTHVKLLRRFLPNLRRVAILADQGMSTCLSDANRRAFESQDVETQTIGIAGPDPDLAEAFAGMAQFRADALIVLEHPATGVYGASIGKLATSQVLPTLFARDHANQDSLLAYGTSLITAARQTPRLLKRILDCSPPTINLIERFHFPELLVNQKAATALGIESQSILVDVMSANTAKVRIQSGAD
jgi:putative tryptophan/tyrosine transport system substrate-binding protein